MKLHWTKVGDIPHGFLCATPIHLIYRIRDAASIGELKRIQADLKQQLKDLRAAGPADADAFERLLQEHGRVYERFSMRRTSDTSYSTTNGQPKSRSKVG